MYAIRSYYDVDKGAELMIRKLILTHFPDHAILGEESVDPGAEASANALTEAKKEAEYLWIIDPIDGTTNFVQGYPRITSYNVCYTKLLR